MGFEQMTGPLVLAVSVPRIKSLFLLWLQPRVVERESATRTLKQLRAKGCAVPNPPSKKGCYDSGF